MKNTLYTILALFSISFPSLAQADLEEKKEYELLSNYEITSGKNLDTKSLFKLTTNGRILSAVEVAFEQKIGKSFSLSLNADIDYAFLSEDYVNPAGQAFHNQLELYVDGRYYLQQRKQIENGFGSNLNGIYINTGVGAYVSAIYKDVELDNFKRQTHFGIGVQSRFLKHGVVDLNLKARFEARTRSISPTIITPTIRVGFALSRNYQSLDFKTNRCNILKCFDERRYQFKIPINGAADFRALDLTRFNYHKFGFLNLSPDLIFELRLFRGVSLNTRFGFTLNQLYDRIDGFTFAKTLSGLNYTNNVRWYFLKRRNIASGKSADNLSGIYLESDFTVLFNNHYTSDKIFEADYYFRHRQITTEIGLNLGYQTRLFDRLYLDVRAYALDYNNRYRDVIPGAAVFPDNGTKFGVNFEFGFLF